MNIPRSPNSAYLLTHSPLDKPLVVLKSLKAVLFQTLFFHNKKNKNKDLLRVRACTFLLKHRGRNLWVTHWIWDTHDVDVQTPNGKKLPLRTLALYLLTVSCQSVSPETELVTSQYVFISVVCADIYIFKAVRLKSAPKILRTILDKLFAW